MDKEKVYKQIKDFNEQLTNPSDRSSKSYEKAYLYVDDKNAIDKANFIHFLIEQGILTKTYNNIIDLAFGSGNLTSHIIFDNEINYKSLIFNDINKSKTNQRLIDNIENSQIWYEDVLGKDSFVDDDIDLVIFNPQIGGNYIDGDILRQKEEDENQQELFNRLGVKLENLVHNGTTVLFYGKEENFKKIFPIDNYIHYRSKSTHIFIVSNSISEYKCFEKSGNSFIECKNSKKNDDTPESFDDVILDMNDFLDEKDEAKEEETPMKEEDKNKIDNEELGKLNFHHKNLLLKGVPGTGKSHTLENIIENDLDMNSIRDNVLRINIHSASSNSDLMQGISISTDDKSNILYQEKRGAILKHIFKAMYKPNQPFVLVLEEIQENSLNELIGDLIYLIEKKKIREQRLN